MKVRNENNEFKEIVVKGLGFSFKLGDRNIIQVLLKGEMVIKGLEFGCEK